MMQEYHAICANGAKTLESVMRQLAMAEPVAVYGTHGKGFGRHGSIVALPESATPPDNATRMYAVNGRSWEAIAYRDLHAALYESGRSIPFFA